MKISPQINKPGVIVLGGHVQALGIVRIFGRNGISAVIIDNTKINLARHSRFCNEFYRIEDSELINFLFELGIAGKFFKWLLLPTNDFQLKLLSTNKVELDRYFNVAVDYWEVVNNFYDKKISYKLAEKLQIPFPRTFLPANENDLSNIKCNYPCIIKPAVMHTFYRHFRKKVFICGNYDELLKYYRKAVSFIPPEEIIVQDIIRGPGRNQFSACFLFFNGKSYTSLTACRMRQHPLDFGNATTYAETIDIPILKEYGEKLLKSVDYNGICEIEFKKDDIDDTYKFLEVNTRTWKWHAIAQKADTPFLMNLYNFYISGELELVDNFQSASFRHSLTDLPVQILLFLKGFNYAFRIKKPVVNAVWSKDDLNPWIYEKLYLFYFIKSR